jgi:hypothetical protein
MTTEKATATWIKALPTADGDYYSRIDEYDKSPTPIRIEAGKLFEFGCEKDLSAEYQAEVYEYLGPITPDLFAEVARLREALEQISQVEHVMSPCATRFARNDDNEPPFECDCPVSIARAALSSDKE